MAVTTPVGATIFIGPISPPGTDTAVEYEALIGTGTPPGAWVPVGEVEDLGEFGAEAGQITFQSISDGVVRKLKASDDFGSLSLVCGRDALDAGQNALRIAAASKFEYAFKIDANDKIDPDFDSSLFYISALVASDRSNFGTAENIVRSTFRIEINRPITYVAATTS